MGMGVVVPKALQDVLHAVHAGRDTLVLAKRCIPCIRASTGAKKKKICGFLLAVRQMWMPYMFTACSAGLEHPEVIHNDQERNFKSYVFAAMCEN